MRLRKGAHFSSCVVGTKWAPRAVEIYRVSWGFGVGASRPYLAARGQWSSARHKPPAMSQRPPTGRIRGARTRRPPTPGPPPLGRAHFPTSPPAEITARKFGVYTRSGFNGMNGDDAAKGGLFELSRSLKFGSGSRGAGHCVKPTSGGKSPLVALTWC